MRKKVYYLDDEIDLCNMFREFIETEEIEVSTFTSATVAIAACAESPPDLIIIDYRLSDTTGDVVANAIDSSIEKILVTGELEKPQHEVFSQVITKPFSLIELQSVIEKLK
jgi:DNA-binding response OmpR family regulator